MHPDLQRRLIRLLRRLSSQVILTTHSPEIMAEVEPDHILIVERSAQESSFADSLPAVQRVLDAVGSTQNLQLTRLFRSKRFLIVEGDDIQILKHLHAALVPDAMEAFDAIPSLAVGGWSNWPWAWGSALAMRNAAGDLIQVYCILDSDLHAPEEIAKRKRDAEGLGISLHIWNQKELENYLLVPSVIARVVASRCRTGSRPDQALVVAELEELASELLEGACDSLAAELLAQDRHGGLPRANRRARELISQKIDRMGVLGVVSGKELISRLSERSKQKWGASFGPMTIAREMRANGFRTAASG